MICKNFIIFSCVISDNYRECLVMMQCYNCDHSKHVSVEVPETEGPLLSTPHTCGDSSPSLRRKSRKRRVLLENHIKTKQACAVAEIPDCS